MSVTNAILIGTVGYRSRSPSGERRRLPAKARSHAPARHLFGQNVKVIPNSRFFCYTFFFRTLT